jgi:hypothetical protein
MEAVILICLLLCACEPDKPMPPAPDAGADVVDPYGDGEGP